MVFLIKFNKNVIKKIHLYKNEVIYSASSCIFAVFHFLLDTEGKNLPKSTGMRGSNLQYGQGKK